MDTEVLEFGEFRLSVGEASLTREGRAVKVAPQPFKVLTILVMRPGQLVTREELQKELWPGDTFVDFDQGLNFCIKQVRAALGDSADAPKYVETVPKRGYRFIAPVIAVH